MDFLSVAEVAEKWNLSSRSIRNYCVQGRIPGAFLTGKTWNIPSDAVKPLRANARMAKSSPLLQRLQVELEGKLEEKMERWVYLNDLNEQILAQKEGGR